MFIILQYGVLADIYSLAVILFELFSGTDPFPGNLLQVFRAKQNDETPEIPLEFPTALKNLIRLGWSKKPRERPEIKKFKSGLYYYRRKRNVFIFIGMLCYFRKSNQI
jgi:serine/threonine protein kinase